MFKLISANDRQPHIVFIFVDDLGWNDVSFHGSPQIPTPNIDALAASGIALHNYYSQPLCTPSRASLMTGIYPIHLGLQHKVIKAGAPYGLPLSKRILPEYLKDQGYVTHGVGKWHLGFYKREYLPTSRGFDSYFGFWNGLLDYYDGTTYEFIESNASIPDFSEIHGWDLHDGEMHAPIIRGKYATDLFTEKAVNIIMNHNTSKPLFLYVPYLAVHVGNPYQPLQAPWDYVARFNYIEDMKRRIYAGMVAKLDESVGEIFNALYNAGMLDNTILVVTSDNGAPAESFLYGYGSNWPLRGLKFQTFEGGVRVPSLVWSPLFNLNKPRISKDLMHITDWLPTLYAAAGGKVEDLGHIDGVNMWDHIRLNVPGQRSEVLVNIDPIIGQAALIKGFYKILLQQEHGGFFINSSKARDYNNNWYGPSGREITVNSMDAWVWKHGSIIKEIMQNHNTWLLHESDSWRFGFNLNCEECSKKEQKDDFMKPQLFNLNKDPCECENVADEHPEIFAELWSDLQRYNATALTPLFTDVDPHSDPRCHGFTFVPWKDDDYKSECPYF